MSWIDAFLIPTQMCSMRFISRFIAAHNGAHNDIGRLLSPVYRHMRIPFSIAAIRPLKACISFVADCTVEKIGCFISWCSFVGRSPVSTLQVIMRHAYAFGFLWFCAPPY